MKILFLSNEGSCYPLAAMMEQEGHEAKFYTKDPDYREGGEGFVEEVADWKDWVKWADYVICDTTGWGKINDEIRAGGTPVVGGTALSDAIEEEREAGQRMFKALGMDTLESQEFHNIGEAIKYVSENPRRYVVKVSGDAQNDKSTTYVGQMEDGSDVCAMLEHMGEKDSYGGSVEVQRAISGVEIAVGGFFNGKDFLDPVFISFEHKKVCANKMEQSGMGPATAEMGTTGMWKDKGFKFYEETIGRFAKVLRKEGYRGYFDINCIIHNDYLEAPEKGYHIHPLEFTARFGWPTVIMQMETMKNNDLGELFYGIATGKGTDFKVSETYCQCVVVAVPPLPYTNQEIADAMSNGMPVIFRRPFEMDGIYPGDVKRDEEGQWIICGKTGYAVVVAAGGDTWEDASQKCYYRVSNVIAPNSFYREDIGALTPYKVSEIKSFLEHTPVEVTQ